MQIIETKNNINSNIFNFLLLDNKKNYFSHEKLLVNSRFTMSIFIFEFRIIQIVEFKLKISFSLINS
jgi:hypothetical protein